MKKNYTYRNVFSEELEIFRADMYQRIGISKLFKKRRVLDIGCGYGPDTKNFSRYAKKVTGLDTLHHESWKRLKLKNATFVVGSAEKLPFKNATFDAVFLKDVLHHVDYPEKILKEIKRVTKPNANIILVEGNRYNPIFYVYATKMNGHEHLAQRQYTQLVKKYFPKATFLHFECYPPFGLSKRWYKKIIVIERFISKFQLLKPLFSYNVAVIKAH